MRFDRAERRRQGRAAKKNPIPAVIDLVEYVKLRTRATTGDAEMVVRFGAFTVDGKPVGFEHINGRRVTSRYIPAHLRDKIVLQSITPEALAEATA